MILLCLSRIAIIEILQIACANANQNDSNNNGISKSKVEAQNKTLPPKKRKRSSYENEVSQCDLGEFKNSPLTNEQDVSLLLEQEQPIEISNKLRIICCENSAHSIIILAYLSDLEYRRALRSKYNTYYEQRINAKEYNQAAFGVLIKQFEQTQFILETIRDAKDITTFTAIKKAQDEFKCSILQDKDILSILNVSDKQVDEHENKEKIKNHYDIWTGLEIMSNNLSENPKKSKPNSKNFPSVLQKDIISKLFEVEAKFLQIKEDIIAINSVEDEVAEIHMRYENYRLAIEDSIIKRAEEVLDAMYALNNKTVKKIYKVVPDRNAVEMEKARQTVEDVITNHAIECRLEQHAKEHAYAKQKKHEKIARQAVVIEEARQTEERELVKQHKASKNNMNVKNTRSAVEYTITQPA
ncbi:hypothetical protein COBT_002544, partial [Conglomerata obtusa]